MAGDAQQNLFDTEPAPWELDDQEDARIATVVFVEGLAGEFDYIVPDSLAETELLGRHVTVPLGRSNRSVAAYCVRVENRPLGSRRLKSLKKVNDPRQLLTQNMLDLTHWIADYYMCPWGQVIEAVLPASVRSNAGTRNATLFSIPKRVIARRKQLKLSQKQQLVFDLLAASAEPLTMAELLHRAQCTSAPVNALRKKGFIESEVRRVSNYHHEESPTEREGNLQLNSDQKNGLEAILESLRSARHQTVLIHGVTGSGKTEVYMQAIEEVISFGRQAIVLVPEISLTPQTRRRFRRRFDRVAVLHSHLSDAERAWHWEQIAAGEVQVVVGARSAIFAPTPNLGLVILDEEHESSFKQDTAPRYHAREVAIRRTAAERVPLVLGSATPSLDSWRRASEGEYRLVDMPSRVLNRPLPDVVTVDLRNEEHKQYSGGAISRTLHQAMSETLAEGNQVILLLNRRGFSTHIQCPACGAVVRCPDCDLPLTHHRTNDQAICHQCDYSMAAPTNCPECNLPGIRYRGRGTQKLEDEVRRRFPNYVTLRMDTDSMQKPGSHEAALERFRQGEVQILLGTQMIAKGLDFPNVTLVGVINADTALHLADFRAAERTFHLVTQVAGRTGRGEKGGRVIVQTYDPDHPAIQAAARHHYEQFAQSELPHRKEFQYPPFSSLVRIVVRSEEEEAAYHFAQHIGDQLNNAAGKATVAMRVMGPAPPPFPKLRNKFRFHLIVQSSDPNELHKTVAQVTDKLKTPDRLQWIVDVDPLDML